VSDDIGWISDPTGLSRVNVYSSIDSREEVVKAPLIAQNSMVPQANYSFRMRYRNNQLRVWFTPEDLKRSKVYPLAEAPMPKDKWIAPEAEALMAPPLPFPIEEMAAALFSGVVQEPPIPNPEMGGGQIVLIAENNNKVQRPPQSLDRMHACLQKQVAFN
jgi:hypothetical protein